MENNKTNGIVSAIAGTLGAIHFVGQSVADLAVVAEANIVHKYIGTAKDEVIKQRDAITYSRQEKVICKYASLAERLRNMRKVEQTTEIVNK